MLSSKKEILNESVKDNLESYLRNLQINNPNETINSEFLKNYLQKIEKQLETNKNNSNNSESIENELEILRVNWREKFQNENEEFDNEKLIKIEEKNKKPRKSVHRRSSGKIIVRESDAFMKGPWILDEENDDINLENENDDINLENENIIDNNNYVCPIINEEEKQLLDLKMDHSQNDKNIQSISLINNTEDEKMSKEKNNKIESVKKVEENTIKEKTESKTPDKNEEMKKVEVPKKRSTLFNIKKYLFGFFGKSFNSNNNEENSEDDIHNNNKEVKLEESRGILSSSSASSLSDNDDMNDRLEINKKSINEKEAKSNENKQLVTIDI
ncbi:hypothetical protein PIROE2DRAFT_1303, partial [Piromyces sp. E2]